ncbi:MAG TPA: tetratricopeptide repeat protein [Pirellulales bacterium]|nr:tetratricopeptide repeat protein [Pirellulales bacterium]
MRARSDKHWIALALLLAAGAGCQSGWPTKRLFARTEPAASASTDSTSSNSPNAAAGAVQGSAAPAAQDQQGVVPASFDQPRYVPPSGTSIVGLGGDGDDELVEKKTWLEKTGEKMAPKNVGKKFKKFIGQGPNETYAQQQYEEGQKLYGEKKFEEAAKCFKRAAGRWPDSALEEDAMFKQAESWFFADRYTKASDAYQALLKKYEGSRYEDRVALRYFAIAKYWDECSQNESHWYPNFKDKTRPFVDASGHAISLYTASRTTDLHGELADDATMAMANAYFRKNRFEDAAANYDMVRKDFSNSPHVLNAHVLGLQSRLRSYQGPQYEASPLDEAEKLATQALDSFPDEYLGAEKQRLLQAKRSIRYERAHRDFEAGEYYYKIKYFRAARIYYQRTIEEFPDTPFAKLADDRIAEIKDLPPVPHDYFEWVKKVLPASKNSYNR